MTSKRFKFFVFSNKKKIRYRLLNKEKDLFIIFFHGFMSDITGEKPLTFRKYCIKKKIGFLTFEYSGHENHQENLLKEIYQNGPMTLNKSSKQK